VLARLLPVMGLAVSSQTKEAWAACFAACTLAVRQQHRERAAAAGGGGATGMRLTDEDRALGMAVQAAHDVLGATWALSKDARLQAAGTHALAAMTCLLPRDNLMESRQVT
jgi:hypothetical protein